MIYQPKPCNYTMRRLLLFLCFLPFGCSTQKSVVTDSSVIQAHSKPVKIFGIGYWRPGYMILTLLDAKNEYFTITAKRDDSLKINDIYSR